MTMNNLHDLFEHELKDIYAAEQQIVHILEQMKGEARDRGVQQAVEQHLRETKNHVARIESVFQDLNLSKGGANCPTVEGLAREKKDFQREGPTPDVLEIYNVGAGVKTERYEISAYEGLIEMAEKLGIQDVAAPLQENLREEQAMLERLKEISKDMSAGRANTEMGTRTQQR